MSLTINKLTLSEQIYRILREDILNQEIKCGEKLTLKALKERFNVSHTPIREALTRLVEDNLVTYYSNVGVTVVTLNENDIKEIFQFNGDLDCLALQYAMNSPKKLEFLAKLNLIIQDSEDALASGDMAKWRDYSDDFHLIFYTYANNSRLEIAAKKLRAQTTLLYNLYQFESQNALHIQEDHAAINTALQNGNIDTAKSLFKAHLDKDMTLALNVSAKLNGKQ
ncbi:GntR family transcriptional regulator [Fusibacter paucivorans]|uniref:GntR family transcriptional regulator n=1 Tax=Fusibacter paucivorans TaxID=76009 RepID=A0ABS5PKG2_9FIRM|nr:GntR family transcriptional regulator [Fusibacter paucivorans]MBS7525372.1 GntR family transcriptional regulator [Fusibacter paucivorans]